MSFLDRFRSRPRQSGGPNVRESENADMSHLKSFVETRTGVEGFIEPRTTVSSVTLLLVAHDGEWTRRRVPSEQWARDFAARNGFASYDAGVVGIPKRMRDYISRQKKTNQG
ncbi:MAG TPA: hypothetical protein PKX56_09415 [Marmoricola sp.]|nr:hypothetical protein [Marmoricola sp.]HNI71445.1 hypothetical protein [Marmoricola sp.]HNJ79563.1 hypothetical protein [Marmoricola sp.]HNN47617.1 hypothetical protein [Marmoricola sp.]HNO40448.1 hypothetical protein [Marmoricola sp.]